MMMSPEQAFDKAREIFEQMMVYVEKASAEKQRMDRVERVVFVMVLEMGRQVLIAFIAKAGDGDVGNAWAWKGQILRRLRDFKKRTYRSIFGVIEIVRRVYAVREGQESHSPLDQQLALPAGEQSYVLEDWLQKLCVNGAFGRAVESLNDVLGTSTSKRTAERINQELSEYVDSFREEQCSELKDEGEILVVSADGKGVPMRSTLEQRMGLAEPAWRRFQRRKQEKKADQRATKRLSRGQTSVGKQMAYVGAVYTVDRWKRTASDVVEEVAHKKRQEERPKIKNKRVQAHMTQYYEDERWDGQSTLFGELAYEIEKRDPRGKKPLVCIMDGQRSLWNLQKEWLPDAACIVDIFHVLEKLWEIAYCFHPQGSRDAENFVTHLLEQILKGQVARVIRAMRRKGKRIPQSKRTKLDKLLNYLENNKQYMAYNDYLAQGYPIGSGVVEGTCRHLVRDRMELTGMRWEIEGAQAMLNTRSAYVNGEWDNLIEYRIQREQERLYGQAG